ncbi:MAG: excalibur calcium-binding domain-containing protein [Rhodobacteraceae bacterium]|nr:excalibur calcium-binding domain-containing protein [Paracoccaceae bacterium]
MIFGALAVFLAWNIPAAAETWRGIEVAPEHRCSPYNRRDYRYSGSTEKEIVERIGAVYGPYSGTCFNSTDETDIEHIIAVSEAHDSGLCARSREVRRQFASDIRNLTLAAPELNRNSKRGKDAADWIPEHNACWFAARIVEVRRLYGLTIDRREMEALEQVLRDCPDTEMQPLICHRKFPRRVKVRDASTKDSEVLRRYDDNGNGRITCKEARRHGIAPVQSDHPAYVFMHDGDGDGVVCE